MTTLTTTITPPNQYIYKGTSGQVALRVSNTGAVTAQNVTAIYTSDYGFPITNIVVPPGVTYLTSPDNKQVNFTIGNILSGNSVDITIYFDVPLGAPDVQHEIELTAIADNAPEAEVYGYIAVGGGTFSINVVASPVAVKAGDLVTFIITVTNTSTGDASATAVNYSPFPVISVSPIVSIEGNRTVNRLNNIGPGASVNVIVVARVPLGTPSGIYHNLALTPSTGAIVFLGPELELSTADAAVTVTAVPPVPPVPAPIPASFPPGSLTLTPVGNGCFFVRNR